MIIVKSVENVPVRLSQERWEHIIKRHPEMKYQKERVLETIENPDLVQKGDFGGRLAIKFYEDTPLTSKFLVVIYKEVSKLDGFIITAYYTNKPSGRRKALWKR